MSWLPTIRRLWKERNEARGVARRLATAMEDLGVTLTSAEQKDVDTALAYPEAK